MRGQTMEKVQPSKNLYKNEAQKEQKHKMSLKEEAPKVDELKETEKPTEVQKNGAPEQIASTCYRIASSGTKKRISARKRTKTT
ncbi:hypothetical protein L596_029205 [Steinernema carpocapsae]|uniref:Uncharacterized protein n=1 Tax=Steinernema carpocapsae TaxID=34508 RepID=A0A4U5LTZ3_STECR|nr:hypothetical protein L596_029205 [Steinernema carpocapsae]